MVSWYLFLIVMRKVIFLCIGIVSSLFSSCVSYKNKPDFLEIPDYITCEFLNLKVLNTIPKSTYYLIQAENEQKEILYVVSYKRNENSLVDPKYREKTKMKRGKVYSFVVTPVRENIMQNFSQFRFIRIDKDILWENSGSKKRMFQSKPRIYQGINVVGLQVY